MGVTALYPTAKPPLRHAAPLPLHPVPAPSTTMVPDKHSPIKNPPPRVAGQSLDEELTRLLDEEVTPWLVVATLMTFLGVLEWLRWAFDVQPHPVMMSISVVLVVAFCLWKVLSYRRRIHALKLGRDGEREVGAMLEELRAEGCVVLHDIVGDNFNLDHVVLSTHGIFTVETKVVSKPDGKPIIRYDGQKVSVDGSGDHTAAVDQALAEAAWLRQLSASLTGKTYPIQPVVVFPGWWVENEKAPRQCPAWVLNPKALGKFITSTSETISEAEVRALVHHLRQHIQNQQRQS